MNEGTSPIEYANPAELGRARQPWFSKQFRVVALASTAVILAGFVILPSLGQMREPAKRIICANNLRQIGVVCLQYARGHGDAFPDSMDELLQYDEITSQMLICPSSTDSPAAGATSQALAAKLMAEHHLSYVYVGKGLKEYLAADAILAYEPLSNHGGAGMNVLYADGHVEFQDGKTAGVIVAEIQSGHNPPRTGNTTTVPVLGK